MNNTASKYIIEFIGTFFLVFTIGLSGNPIAIGAVLGAMVYMGSYVSGGHYNPAVTLAVLLQKKIKANEAAIYMLVQLVAAIIAAATYQLVIGKKMLITPDEGISFAAAFIVELLFTFALVSVVLHAAVSKRSAGNEYYGLAIGLVLMAAAFAGGHISGGAFNPAVGLGPSIYGLTDHLSNYWLYLLGPMAGGLIASYVFTATQKDKDLPVNLIQ